MPHKANLLSLALLIFLGAIVLQNAGRFGLGFDEAYNLNLAKTLAQNGRYATRSASGYQYFDPAVSSGPMTMLPLALAIALGGPTLAAARAAAAAAFLFSLAASGWAAAVFWGRAAGLAFTLLFFLMPYTFLWGISAQGDILAVGFSLAAFGMLLRAEQAAAAQRTRWQVAAGFALGLALWTKDISALLLLALAAAWLFGLPDQAFSLRRGLSQALPIFVAAGMAGGWQAAQTLAVWLLLEERFAAWQALRIARAQFMGGAVMFSPFSHLSRAWNTALDDFGYLLAAGALAVAAGALIKGGLRWLNWQSYAQRSLVCGLALWLGWYFFLSGPQANYRHNFPAYVLAAFLLIGLLAALLRQARAATAAFPRRVAAAALAGVLALCLLLTAQHGVRLARLHAADGENALAAQRQVVAWVQQNIPPQDAISGYGWFVPWQIAYLADRVPASAALYTPGWPGLTEWFILTPEVGSTGSLDAVLEQFLENLGEPEYSQSGYRIDHINLP